MKCCEYGHWCTDMRTDGQKDKMKNRLTDRQEGQDFIWTNGQTDRQTGQMERQADRQDDRRTEKLIDRRSLGKKDCWWIEGKVD